MPAYRASGFHRRRFPSKKAYTKRRGAPYTINRKPRRALSAVGAPSQPSDPSLRVMNCRLPFMRLERTLGSALTLSWSNQTPLSALIFDPSGTYGNTAAAIAPLAIQDWASLITVFDQYKVNRITCNFQYETQGAVLGPVPIVFNTNFERNVTVPTMAGILQTGQAVEKTFSPEHSRYTNTFVPKVNTFVDNSAVIASEGLAVHDMDWCDVNYPPQLYGLQLASSYALAATQFLFFEITYDISFRYSK